MPNGIRQHRLSREQAVALLGTPEDIAPAAVIPN